MPEKKLPPEEEIVGIDDESGRPVTRAELLKQGFGSAPRSSLFEPAPPEQTKGGTELGPEGVLELGPKQEVTDRFITPTEPTQTIIKPLDRLADESLATPKTPQSADEERWEQLTGHDEKTVGNKLAEIEGDEPLEGDSEGIEEELIPGIDFHELPDEGDEDKED